MASTGNGPGSGPQAGHGQDNGLAFVPTGWLLLMVLLSVYNLLSGAPFLFDTYDMPIAAQRLVWAALGFGAVTLVWGLVILALAFQRSARFPSQFIAWQSAAIVFIVAREIYVLVEPTFAFSARALAISGGEVVIGLLCIWLLRRGAGAEAVYSSPPREKTPAIVFVIAAVLGLLAGAAAGCGIGLGIGSVIADLAHVSCFEGGCGYFVAFIGLAGLSVGAIAGIIAAIWLVNRRNKRAAAAN